MPRASRSIAKRARHKKWLKRAKGFRGRRRTVFKLAKEAVIKAGQYAYRDRRRKKTTFRTKWQISINAAARDNGVTYGELMHALRRYNSALNRKVLAELSHSNRPAFNQLIQTVTNKSRS